MNQEPNNNIENTQTVPNNTINNSIQQSVVQPTNSGVENVQPAIAPTVNVSAPIEVNTPIEVETKPHDVPIPDSTDKKDFVIKSKKETVEEETRLREARIEEHIKKANENYQPNSKFTVILLVFFLIFIIGFTWFLPQIHNFVVKLQKGDFKKQEEIKITNGTLNCIYEKSSDAFDYTYEYDFVFSKNLLNSYKKITTTKGDAAIDRDKLDLLKNDCNSLKDESSNIVGITVSCNNESNSVKVTENIELSNFKSDSITSSYTEAGGEYPEYSLEQDMDIIEKNMKASGYTCERIGS